MIKTTWNINKLVARNLLANPYIKQFTSGFAMASLICGRPPLTDPPLETEKCWRSVSPGISCDPVCQDSTLKQAGWTLRSMTRERNWFIFRLTAAWPAKWKRYDPVITPLGKFISPGSKTDFAIHNFLPLDSHQFELFLYHGLHALLIAHSETSVWTTDNLSHNSDLLSMGGSTLVTLPRIVTP